MTAFVTRLTRRVQLVEQKLLTLPEHLSSPSFSRVCVNRSLVLCVCFVDSDYLFGIFKFFSLKPFLYIFFGITDWFFSLRKLSEIENIDSCNDLRHVSCTSASPQKTT